MCAKQAGSRLLTAVFKESTPRDLLLFRYRLILGEQALRDGEDLKDICDACNCDLYEAIARVCLKALTY